MHGLYSGRVLCRQRSQCTRSITSKSRERLKIGLEGRVLEYSQLKPMSSHLNASTPATVRPSNCQNRRRLTSARAH
jgi:hypothetical protein